MSDRQSWRSGRPEAMATAALDRHLVQNATPLFLFNVRAATSMAQLAVAAGASKLTIYRRPPPKKGLVADAVVELARGAKGFDLAIQGDYPNSVIALRKTFSYVFDLASKPWLAYVCRILIAERSRFPDLIDQVTLVAFTPVNGILIQPIVAACASGKLCRDLQTEALLQFLTGAMTAWFVQERLLGGTRLLTRQQRETYVDRTWDIFIRGAAR